MIYKQNPLGIYIYPNGVYRINDIDFEVNSISYTFFSKARIINNRQYGISLTYEHTY